MKAKELSNLRVLLNYLKKKKEKKALNGLERDIDLIVEVIGLEEYCRIFCIKNNLSIKTLNIFLKPYDINLED